MTFERFRMRRGTAAAWTSVNPVLDEGEEGYETDTGRRKVGDGTTAWNSLGYVFDATLAAVTFATVVKHGSIGSTPRPSGATLVLWIGSATPANAATNDEWWNTTTAPAVLERYNGSSWDMASGSSSSSPVLACTQYQPAAPVSYSTGSAAYVDVDAANLAVTFVGPASGRVLVELQGHDQNSGTNANYWNLRSGSTNVANSGMKVAAYAATPTASRRAVASVELSVTPGTSYTWKWGWRTSAGTANLYAGQSDDYGPAVMKVVAL